MVGMVIGPHNQWIAMFQEQTYRPTLGIFNRCTKIHRFGLEPTDHCATYVTGLDMANGDFPNFWKSALLFFTVALALLGVSVLMAGFSLCRQAIFKKSIFTVTGLIQSIAGEADVVGVRLKVVVVGGGGGSTSGWGCRWGWRDAIHRRREV